MGEPIDLQFEQKMQQVEAARISRLAVDVPQRAVQQLLYRRRILQKRLPPRTQALPYPAAFLGRLGIAAAVLRERADLLEHFLKPMQIAGPSLLFGLRQRAERVEDEWQGLRIE